MNADRALRMIMRLVFRYGLSALNKRGTSDPKAKEAANKLRMGRRIGRF